MKAISTLFFLMITVFSFGQITSEYYFSDTTSGNIDHIFNYLEVEDGILVAARKDLPGSEEPLLLKLNLNGEVVWSTLNTTLLGTPNCKDFIFDLFDDGFIYGSSYESIWNGLYHFKTIWKVDAETGEVKWAKPFYALYDGFIIRMADYDSTTFVMAYIEVYDTCKIAIMDKATGDTISTKYFKPGFLDIKVDQNKNIYLSHEGRLAKFNGKDLDQILWDCEYVNGPHELSRIHRLYIDDYDNIFLFGLKGGAIGNSRGLIIKVNASTGLEEWNTNVIERNHFLTGYVDFEGKIYATYRPSLDGGVNYFHAAKVNKADGNLDWEREFNITSLVPPSNYCDDDQASLSIDVDCFGDVYLTGNYCHGYSGTGAWGIMKLANANGDKLFDLTITNDSSNIDELSGGDAVCVFGQSPVFLGQLEDTSGNSNLKYVTIDPTSGNIVQCKNIGGTYQYVSRTLDLVNRNDSIYVYKQIGKSLSVEMYAPNGNLVWEKPISGSVIVKGGQIKITDSYIYLTFYEPDTIQGVPFISNLTQSLIVSKLDKNNGDILGSEVLNFTNSEVLPFELEADNSAAFIFYNKDNTIYYRKWDSTGMSPAFLLEPAGNNQNYQGKLNIVFNNNTSLLALGSNKIYIIDKATLTMSPVFTYSSARDYYDVFGIGNTLFLSGNNLTNEQIITAIDKSNMGQVWEQIYDASGTLYKTISNGTNSLYAMGVGGNTASVHHISSTNGAVIWSFYQDSLNFPHTIPFDISINGYKNYLTVAGANVHADGRTDALITMINLQGSAPYTYLGMDEIGEKSQANTIAVLSDSSIWVGGSLNRITYSKQGFIFSMDYDSTSQSGIMDVSHCLDVFIHPNPTHDILYQKGLNGIFNYSIFDVLGRCCQEQKDIQTSTIYIADLRSGIYFIRFEQNNHMKTIKFVKN